MAGLRPEEEKPRSVLPVPAGEDAEMPRRKIRHPARACTAEEKREFPEMNLTDHAGVRLIHGKPKVNGVEIHYAIGGGGEPVFLLHGVPNVPELLLAGRERQFWTYYARRQMWDPSAMAEEDIDEIVHSAEQPGGNRAILEMYRARQTDAEQNRPHYADPISCPVLAVGAEAYLGDEVARQLAQVARDVRGAVIPASGHNIALENPAALAEAYLDFFAGG